MGHLSAPAPLRASHDLKSFDSGEPELDEWLKTRAIPNERGGASRTYVVCEARSHQVRAYYSLAVGAVQRESSPGRIRRNMPEPIPVMILARLAVDRSCQHQGIGSGLLQDAILRSIEAAEIAGIRALLVHAISDAAQRFYENAGFTPSPISPYTLMLLLSDARLAIGRQEHPE